MTPPKFAPNAMPTQRTYGRTASRSPRPYVRWNSAQDAQLAALWATETLQLIAEHLNRSPNAIYRRAMRLGLVPFSPMDGCFSQASLADAFGVHHRTVARWAALGLLAGSQHPITRRWAFSYEQVQAFVHAHHDALPPRIHWTLTVFEDAVAAATARAEQASQETLAELGHVARRKAPATRPATRKAAS